MSTGHWSAGSSTLDPTRCALLVVDADEPMVASIGDAAVGPLARAGAVLGAARDAGVVVLHSRLRFRADGLDGGHFFRRNPSLASYAGTDAPSHPPLAPTDDEPVVRRSQPSAFFGTSLSATIRGAELDGVVVVGPGTAGGIRACVVDAMQHGFATTLVGDAVVDVSQNAHQHTLGDLAAHYADVVTTDDLLGLWGVARPTSPTRTKEYSP